MYSKKCILLSSMVLDFSVVSTSNSTQLIRDVPGSAPSSLQHDMVMMYRIISTQSPLPSSLHSQSVQQTRFYPTFHSTSLSTLMTNSADAKKHPEPLLHTSHLHPDLALHLAAAAHPQLQIRHIISPSTEVANVDRTRNPAATNSHVRSV